MYLCSTLFIVHWTLVYVRSLSYVPETWRRVCIQKITLHNLTKTDQKVAIQLNCTITEKNYIEWKLMDLRTYQKDNYINVDTEPENRTATYKIRVTCDYQTNVSIFWPMRVKGLTHLYVSGCIVIDFYSAFGDKEIDKEADELLVLEYKHVQQLRNPLQLIKGHMIAELTSEYDCGQDSTLQVYVMHNTTFLNQDVSLVQMPEPNPSEYDPALDFLQSADNIFDGPIKPDDQLVKDKQILMSDANVVARTEGESSKKVNNTVLVNSTTSDLDASERFFNFLKNATDVDTQCDYEKLVQYENSMTFYDSSHFFEILVQGAEYPEVKFMNFSWLFMKEFPRELSQWRRFFPKLEYLDLSHNNLSSVSVKNYPPQSGVKTVTFNLQYNNFTEITMNKLEEWSSVEKFHVDIRNNPFECTCEMKDMLKKIQDDSTFTGKLKQYDYVRKLHCAAPKSIKGRRLYSLTVDELPCPVFESNSVSLIIIICILSFFVALSIIAFIFRNEIRILLYTRLHIRLPCDTDYQKHSKTYDAFVSYSNEDDAWVHQNIVKLLEGQPTNKVLYSNGNIYEKPIKVDQNGHTNLHDKGSSKCGQFRLCIHQRDFVAGKTIFDNIVDCIEASRHTIIILSPSFMRSHWAMEELRQSYRQSLVEKTKHLIVVLLEKVAKEDMDPLISRCCKTFTYLDVSDSLFKDRLIFSLTTKDKSAKRRDRNERKKKKEESMSDEAGYDNIGYVSTVRPNEPMRELSSTSTTALTNY